MIAVEFTGPRGAVGMGVVPADEFEAKPRRGTFGIAHITGRQGKTVARGIIPAIDQRKQRADFPPGIAVGSQHRATALVRIILRAVVANFFFEVARQPQHHVIL